MEGQTMEGRIKYLNREENYGYIETYNRKVGDVSFRLVDGKLQVDDTVSFLLQRSQNGKYYARNVTLVERNEIRRSTEDKLAWCAEGQEEEQDFVNTVVPHLHRDIIINPKKKTDPYAIDLEDRGQGRYADLKKQTTPFFTAAGKDPRYDPRFTVTFNRKDYERYRELYPGCDIYYWVDWQQLSGYGVSIQPLTGVWVASFASMAALIESGQLYLHQYDHRKTDDVNAKDSYLFDLRHPIFQRLL